MTKNKSDETKVGFIAFLEGTVFVITKIEKKVFLVINAATSLQYQQFLHLRIDIHRVEYGQ